MQKFTLHSTVAIEDILKLVPSAKKDSRTMVNGTLVNLGTTRMRTFARSGVVCVTCGTEGEYFAIERQEHHGNAIPYHANLYGTDSEGKEVLFTHDHILARGLGDMNLPEGVESTGLEVNEWLKYNTL